MGLGGIGIWQLLIVLVIVLLLFGTKRLRGLGGDLGGAIKGFKKAMTNENAKTEDGDAIDEEDPKKVVDETAEHSAEDVAQSQQTEQSKQTESK